MEINPGEKRDYESLLNAVIKFENSMHRTEKNITVEEIKEFSNQYKSSSDIDNGILLIIDCAIRLLCNQYNQISSAVAIEDYNEKLLGFFKIIIYDFIDYREAVEHFVGIQLFNVERSIIEHTRMFITCLLDEEFERYYFAGYETEEQKKKRYYEKSGTKIDKKLKDFYDKAKQLFEDGTDTSVKYLLAINSDNLYVKLHQQLSEMAHLNEFVIAEKVVNNEKTLNFSEDKTSKYNKYYDAFIEYMVGTCTIIFMINKEKLQLEPNLEMVNIYNILVTIHQKTQDYRQVDYLLETLKEKCREIMNDNEE
jgi:hypothetical protein